MGKIIQNKIIINDKIINITGGGSLIHTIKTNFTKFTKNNNNYLLFGTEMTDQKGIVTVNSSNINDFINNMNSYSFKK